MTEAIEHLFHDVETRSGQGIDNDIGIADAITYLTTIRFWVSPQALNHAAKKGVVELPDNCAHIAQATLTRDQPFQLAEYLDQHGQ